MARSDRDLREALADQIVGRARRDVAARAEIHACVEADFLARADPAIASLLVRDPDRADFAEPARDPSTDDPVPRAARAESKDDGHTGDRLDIDALGQPQPQR